MLRIVKEIATNRSYGSFDLSYAAMMLLARKKGVNIFAYASRYVDGKAVWTKYDGDGQEPDYLMYVKSELDAASPTFENDAYHKDIIFDVRDMERDDADLVAVIRELGEKAATRHAKLEITEIPDDVDWELCVADQGYEWIAEKHRTW